MNIIEVQNVTKKYSNHLALDNISLSIRKGIVYGLLGPNGAGKTTLIRILNQITAPDSGTVLFNGNPLSRKDVEKIGYLPEERGLYKKMKVGEEALYLARLKGLSKDEAMERLKYWFIKFEIQNWWNKKVEELSKGMQQKLQFIITVVHRPDFLILDEPFSGLDPINTNLIRQELLELKRQGTTIIISTHNMASVEEICDEICLINKAHKILEGNLIDVKQQFKENIFSLTLCAERDIPVFPETFSVLETSSSANQRHYVVKVHEGGNSNQLLKFVMDYGNILEFNEILPSMNDIFIQQVEKYNSESKIQNP
ncbi:MAG: ATP-binding cassette domain-containing protein [Bacteroidales bacterium]|nr:ATP-binding cassette domain-containing protein [Bacteroidales bacterium]